MPVSDYETEPIPSMSRETEMVERVARAIVAAYTTVPFDEMSDWNKDTNYRRARAAIAAMREPTEAMKEARPFSVSYGYGDEPWVSPDDAAENWRLMIDAALAEGNGG